LENWISHVWHLSFRPLVLLPLALFLTGCSHGTEGIDSISTENYANPNLEYFYYLPASATNASSGYPIDVLVLVPGLNGRGDQFVSPEWRQFADENDLLVISPSFQWDEKNFAAGTSYQYPAYWSGEALLRMLQQVEEKRGIKTASLYLFGFSAGAQFSLRFCLWRSDLCNACAAHASGGVVLPQQWIGAKFFITVGTQDTDRIQLARDFRFAAEHLGIDVQYREYDTGHSLTEDQIRDSMAFFQASLRPHVSTIP
jgi:poly(3-hydroxybutyrate) depolymerase